MAAAADDATADAFSVLPAEVLVCVAQKLPVLERRHLPAVCQRLRALSRSGRFWSYGDDSSVRLVYSSTDRLKVLVKFLSSLEGPITWRSLELEMKCCVSGCWGQPVPETACAAAGGILRRCWGQSVPLLETACAAAGDSLRRCWGQTVPLLGDSLRRCQGQPVPLP